MQALNVLALDQLKGASQKSDTVLNLTQNGAARTYIWQRHIFAHATRIKIMPRASRSLSAEYGDCMSQTNNAFQICRHFFAIFLIDFDKFLIINQFSYLPFFVQNVSTLIGG
jgi:hypothetical protein